MGASPALDSLADADLGCLVGCLVAFPNSVFNFADPFALSIPAFLCCSCGGFGVFAQAYRYRGLEDPAQRQQTKYVFLA
jgi:hypothetical protein